MQSEPALRAQGAYMRGGGSQSPPPTTGASSSSGYGAGAVGFRNRQFGEGTCGAVGFNRRLPSERGVGGGGTRPRPPPFVAAGSGRVGPGAQPTRGARPPSRRQGGAGSGASGGQQGAGDGARESLKGGDLSQGRTSFRRAATHRGAGGGIGQASGRL